MKKNLLKTTIVAAIMMMMGTAKAQLTYFARGGMNVSNMTVLDPDGSKVDGISSRIGYQIGGGVDFALNDNMGVELSAMYALRGATYSMNDVDATTGIGVKLDSKIALHYIEIPINFRYSLEMGEGKLNILAGPKLGFGMTGNWTGTSTVTFMGQTESSNIDEKMTFGSADTSDFKTLSLSAGISVGYEISNFHFLASYHYGLTNDANKPENKESTIQSMIGLSVGYRFGDN